jgi:hypothetical protein
VSKYPNLVDTADQPWARNKKGEASHKCGHPSLMSLSEEGSSVLCIAVRIGNRSTFFAEVSSRRKSERIIHARNH